MQEQTPYVVESVLGSLSAPLFALRHVAPLMDSSMRISEDLIRLFEKVQESEELLESLLMEVRSWILGLDVYARFVSSTLEGENTDINIVQRCLYWQLQAPGSTILPT